ncbi:MAG: Txe/YoeB family addiction module toxin [Bacteroidales bacterium]|nr:Txe/YoeB family addiction module toxin [Bacteroidales bacterium]
MKNIIFSPEAMEDYHYWKSNSPQMVEKIKRLLTDIAEHPLYGIGKPERLKHQLSGKWSRRIDLEHRIIYTVSDDNVYVLALRYHYKKG